MPPRAKPILPKDLCVYLVEVDHETGAVSEKVMQLVRQCVIDKIFGENQDHIAVCRSDRSSSVVFREPNWDALRKVEESFRIQNDDAGTKKPFSVVRDVVQVMEVQNEEDTYQQKKLLFFGRLVEAIPQDEIRELADILVTNKIATSFILPDTDQMTEVQKSNYDCILNAFHEDKYDDLMNVTTLKQAERQITNTLSKKPVRPSPWNVSMEISSEIIISVSGYVCVRQNKSSEIKKALMKEVKTPVSPQSNNNEASSAGVTTIAEAGGSEKKTIVVEIAKDVTAKETQWKEKDGTVVEEEDIGKGYYYGDQVIPFNEVENLDAYSSGCKCLKVIVFCPKQNILPQYLQGDGTTLFYARPGDGESGVKLEALINAMDQNDRVAVVRKVYRAEAKPVLGVLAPDTVRKCLVFSELCYADDVSVPHFPTLMKPINDEESITSKEELIDSLISSFSLDDFDPSSGPVDPAVQLLRGSIASRILDSGSHVLSGRKKEDSLKLFFEQFQKEASDELVKKLTESFPLAIKREVEEKAAGVNIFRKRVHDEVDIKTEGDKKVKIEAEESVDDQDMNAAVVDEPDYDNLLDDL